MAKFVLLYTGGSMPESPEEGAKVMAAWEAWFAKGGDHVIDMGNPFGGSASAGKVTPTGVNGYSIISADSLAAATAMVADNPQIAAGGGVEVHETTEM